MKFRTFKSQNKDIWLFSNLKNDNVKHEFNTNFKIENYFDKPDFILFLEENNLKNKFNQNYNKNDLVIKKIFKYYLSNNTKLNNVMIIKSKKNTIHKPFSNNFFQNYMLFIQNEEINLIDQINVNKNDNLKNIFENYFNLIIVDWITENKENNILKSNYFSIIDIDKIKYDIYNDLNIQYNMINILDINYDLLINMLNLIDSDLNLNIYIDDSIIKINLKDLKNNNPLNFISKLKYENIKINFSKIYCQIIQELTNKFYFILTYKDTDIIKFKNIESIVKNKNQSSCFNNLIKKIEEL